MSRSGEPQLRTLSELVRLRDGAPLPGARPGARRRRRAASPPVRSPPVPVRATATTSQGGCYRLREGDPIDLRVSRRHGRVALSFLHELGHLVDHQLGHALGPAWASGHHEAFARWRDAASRLAPRLPAGVGRSRRRYFHSVKEVWARSYAQAVLGYSADPELHGHLAGLIEADDVFVWPTAAFAPVADELVQVLGGLGLLRVRPGAAAA